MSCNFGLKSYLRFQGPNCIPLSLRVTKSKTVLDSGFHPMDSGFQVLDFGPCQWNLDSGFQSLVGFRIPWAVFQIPEPRIPDSTSKIARIQDSRNKILSDSNPDSLTWGDHSVQLPSFTFYRLAPELSSDRILFGRKKLRESLDWKVRHTNLSSVQLLRLISRFSTFRETWHVWKNKFIEI